MVVHIIRSPEVSKSLVRTIRDIVKPFDKPVRFIFLREDLTEEPEDLMDDSVIQIQRRLN